MGKLSLENKVFTTKQASLIVLAVVAVIAIMSSNNLQDFLLKMFVYGITSVLAVILSASFLDNASKEDKEKNTKKVADIN
ncbi:MAG: hypothetical protein ACOYL8_04825 [Patescibacteria group bacterium]